MPSGAVILGFHYSGNFIVEHKANNELVKTVLPNFYVAGQQTFSYNLTVTKKNTSNFGVVLRPKALWYYYGIDMRTLRNKAENMETFFGDEFKDLIHSFKKTLTNEERVLLMNNYFKIICSSKTYIPSLIDTALELIYKKKGCVSLLEIKKETGLSERTLQRQFSLQMGVSPTQYARLIRFNNLFTEIAKPEKNLDISFLTSFYSFHDISHLNKEFKRFCGEAPSSFLLDKFLLLKELIQDSPYLTEIQKTDS